MKRNWKKNTPLVILSIFMRKFSFLAILDMSLIWKWIWLWNDIIYTFVNQSFSIVEANIFLMYNSSQYWFSFLDFSLALEKTKMTLFAYRFTIFGLTSFQLFSLRASNVARGVHSSRRWYLLNPRENAQSGDGERRLMTSESTIESQWSFYRIDARARFPYRDSMSLKYIRISSQACESHAESADVGDFISRGLFRAAPIFGLTPCLAHTCVFPFSTLAR